MKTKFSSLNDIYLFSYCIIITKKKAKNFEIGCLLSTLIFFNITYTIIPTITLLSFKKYSIHTIVTTITDKNNLQIRVPKVKPKRR